MLVDLDKLGFDEGGNLLIKRALAATGGNVAQAARRLGINRTRIYRKMADRPQQG